MQQQYSTNQQNDAKEYAFLKPTEPIKANLFFLCQWLST
jgi:hypothetical protein